MVQVQNPFTPRLHLFEPQLGVASRFGVDPIFDTKYARQKGVIIAKLNRELGSVGPPKLKLNL